MTAATAECSLAHLERDVAAVVLAVRAGDAAELASEGLRPGSIVSIVARAPLGGPLVVRLGRARLAVPRAMGTGVIVARLPRGTAR